MAKYYVNGVSGNDSGNDGGINEPWKTLTHAETQSDSAMSDGDEIHVASATYTELLYIQGADGNTISWFFQRGVVIDAEDSRTYCLRMHDCTFKNLYGFLELKNSTSYTFYAHGTIANCNIYAQLDCHDGAAEGVRLADAPASVIFHSIKTHNNGDTGLYISGALAACIVNNLLSYDNAGKGLDFSSTAGAIIYAATICNNTGFGMTGNNGAYVGDFFDLIIFDNDVGAVAGGNMSMSMTFTNCIINGTQNLGSADTTEIDIVSEPIFVNQIGRDYNLTKNSPGVDEGIVTASLTDLIGVSRLIGVAPDIGAYEYVHSNAALLLL